MTYEPLHHKYRPQTFAQLAGQDAIAQTLSNALNAEKIAPAYLFCGPRGTGKTSSARILAKSLNCLSSNQPTATPCGMCETCRSITNGSALDVIEIDAASNTGVDNIREIIERAQYAPVQCRYKVYVIDECHMLSTAAFNALLKTLEEPPNRVIFILATTDPQRVLPTIISRCQRFDYRRIPLDAMVKHLQYIVTEENIDISGGALSLVAQLANGGMRDAESLLDQLSLLAGTITPDRVWDLVGAVSEQDLWGLLTAIASDNSENVILQCRKLLDRGREPLIVLQNLANFYLSLLIAKTAPSRRDLVTVTEETWQELINFAPQWHLNSILQGQKMLKDSEFQIKNTTQPRLWLEITFLSLLPSALSAPQTITTTVVQKTAIPEKSVEVKEAVKEGGSALNLAVSEENKVNNSSINQENIPNNTNFNDLEELKEQVAQKIPQVMSKSFLQQQCEIITYQGNTITLGVGNEFFLKLSKQHQNNIEKGFSQLLNLSINVIFQLQEKGKKSPQKVKSDHEKIKPDKPDIPPPPPANIQPEKPNIPSAPPLANNQLSLQKVAENFAKNVKGEIVLTEKKPPQVINRPVFDDDDDDIPF